MLEFLNFSHYESLKFKYLPFSPGKKSKKNDNIVRVLVLSWDLYSIVVKQNKMKLMEYNLSPNNILDNEVARNWHMNITSHNKLSGIKIQLQK